MKDTIQLTFEERLQLQNLELKRGLIMAEATLGEARMRETAARIGERLGVDLTDYRLNTETGVGVRIQRPIRAVEDKDGSDIDGGDRKEAAG